MSSLIPAPGVTMSASLPIESLLEAAYEIFLTHAADFLPPEDIVDITLEFEERGAVESAPADEGWRGEFTETFIAGDWLEVWIGLLDHQDEFNQLFAKILMPVDGNKAKAKIRWKPTH